MPSDSSFKPKSKAKNPLENLNDTGSGMLDQFFGNYENTGLEASLKTAEREAKKHRKKEGVKIFDYTQYSETTLIKNKIRELTEMIKKEIEMLKHTQQGLADEVRGIEKLTINDLPEKPGVYHIRFLEIVLSIIRHIRAKVGESKTWLEAFVTKKKKRGSLFAVRSKKTGTQYSLSQELQNARNVQ